MGGRKRNRKKELGDRRRETGDGRLGRFGRFGETWCFGVMVAILGKRMERNVKFDLISACW